MGPGKPVRQFGQAGPYGLEEGEGVAAFERSEKETVCRANGRVERFHWAQPIARRTMLGC